MSATHHAQVPGLIAEYFRDKPLGMQSHPLVKMSFTPGSGWTGTGFNKRVSHAWLRKLAARGATSVAITCDGYEADFTIAEIIRHARRPLLGGRLI